MKDQPINYQMKSQIHQSRKIIQQTTGKSIFLFVIFRSRKPHKVVTYSVKRTKPPDSNTLPPNAPNPTTIAPTKEIKEEPLPSKPILPTAPHSVIIETRKATQKSSINNNNQQNNQNNPLLSKTEDIFSKYLFANNTPPPEENFLKNLYHIINYGSQYNDTLKTTPGEIKVNERIGDAFKNEFSKLKSDANILILSTNNKIAFSLISKYSKLNFITIEPNETESYKYIFNKRNHSISNDITCTINYNNLLPILEKYFQNVFHSIIITNYYSIINDNSNNDILLPHELEVYI